MASWLTAVETTRLRAAARSCKALFVRNCPVKTVQNDSVWLYFEEPPHLTPHASFEECAGQNRHSSRPCWRLDAAHHIRSLIGYAGPYASTTLTRSKLLGDRDVVLAAVAQNGNMLYHADESFKRDRDVVMVAVAQYGGALVCADESLKRDRDVVLAAVAKEGWALDYADASLKHDGGVVLAAVANTGWALKYADGSLKRDRGVVLA
eukprot:CAMPEP_0198649704 /NCGR_PEP_ID=MMETSP1467-20131203/4447_1 /TAXON_ID=1462469 /ORGANISM="unid. sp., Strain CCMP2135" /LENGTH=206 /DNA_ID=CAMNT_0044385501 /DNA_START=14 /DNA_END=630 /DNA_ORIENTATION=-